MLDEMYDWAEKLETALEILDDFRKGKVDQFGEAETLIEDVMEDIKKWRDRLIREQEEDYDPIFDPKIHSPIL